MFLFSHYTVSVLSEQINDDDDDDDDDTMQQLMGRH